MLVGIDFTKSYDSGLLEILHARLPDRHLVFGFQPFDKIPEFLSMADIVTIPQRKGYSSVGQTPVKLFDAMAMAKPIISTRVSNIPEILNDCGWLVEPGNTVDLAETIKYVLQNSPEAMVMGQKARIKCDEYYSYKAVGRVLSSVMEQLHN